MTIPITALPVDSTGNGGVYCPYYLNDNQGDCQLPAALHCDNIWTYRQGKAVQSQFDNNALQAWFNVEYDVLYQWTSKEAGGKGGMPGAYGAPSAWPRAEIWDWAQVDVANNPTLAHYAIDQFYALDCAVNLPNDFYYGYSPGSTWTGPYTPNFSLGHQVCLADVRADGFYRLYTWGSWAWVGPEFVKSCFNFGIVVFSPRQFDPKMGLDSKGRHVLDQAVAWTQITGRTIPQSLLNQFPPPPEGPVFTDSGLKPNTTYQYRVRAKNSAGMGPYTPSISVTTPLIPTYLDNGSSYYSTTGTWGTAGGMTSSSQPYGYGGSLQYNNVQGSTATWVLGNLAPGSYKILTTWQNDPTSKNRCEQAVFAVYDGSTQVGSVIINQQNTPTPDLVAGGPSPLPTVNFQSLGVFSINSGTVKVVLTNSDLNSGHYAIADAVCVSFINPPVSPSPSGTPPTVAPTELIVTSATPTGITLDWRDVDGYEVQRSLDGVTWSTIGRITLSPVQS